MVSLPSEALLVPPKPSRASADSAHLRLTVEAIDAIIAAQGHGVTLVIKHNKTHLKVGDSLFPTSSISEALPIDLYALTPTAKLGAAAPPAGAALSSQQRSSPQLHGLGSVTTRVSVMQSPGGESNLASKLKSQSKSLQQEKEANKAQLLMGSDGSTNGRAKSKARGALSPALAAQQARPRSLPGSPLLGSGLGSASSTPPSSSSSASSASSKPRTLPLGSSKSLAAQSLSSGPNRVVHLLALAPNSPKGLAQRTNMNLVDVDAILAEYATRESDGRYVLTPNRYKELRFWEWKPYSNTERAKVIQDARDAFDKLGYPEDSAVRRVLIDPKLRRPDPEPQRPATTPNSARSSPVPPSPVAPSSSLSSGADSVSSPTSPNKTNGVKRSVGGALLKVKNPPPKRAKTSSSMNSVSSTNSHSPVALSSSSDEEEHNPLVSVRKSTPPARESTPKSAQTSPAKPSPLSTSKPMTATTSSSSSAGDGAGGKRKAGASASASAPSSRAASKPAKTATTAKSSGQGDDLFELARKFRQTYSEYEKLYAQVSSAERKKSRADVQRLLYMHRELESWKKKLWTVSPTPSPKLV